LYISQVRLKGFKSFGGTHELSLSPGFTAIVGPNGSGKSNILDAIRWVLGDNSPARLRISRQSDLIFKGSLNYSPSRDVSCSIKLMDDKKVCNLSRSYSSENGTSIHVDGERLRLSDLECVKRDWKFESDQFAFISQGEVADTIRQRPYQRRLQLECLFGIDKYRKNRDEANVKLSSAREELLRLETLLSELEKRRNEIAPEVEKAEKAKILEIEVNELRGIFYHIQRIQLQNKLQNVKGSLSDLETGYRRKSFWAKAWDRSLKNCRERISVLQSVVSTAEKDEKNLELRRNEIHRQSFLSSTAVKNNKDRIFSIDKINLKVDQEIKSLQEEKQQVIEDRYELSCNLRSLSEELEKREKKIEVAKKRFEENVYRRNQLEKELASEITRSDTLRSSIYSGLNYIRNLRQQKAGLVKEMSSLEKDIISRNDELIIKKARYNDIVEKHRKTYAEYQKIASDIQKIRRESHKLESSIEELKNVTEDKAYPDSVRFIVSASRLGKLPPAVPVAEIFSTPQKLSMAIDSYLGKRLFWIVVETVQQAGTCIDMLKEKNIGRVTFLPVERCRNRSPKVGMDHTEGMVGWAMDLLSVNDKWKRAVRHLVGDLMIVDTFHSAKKIVTKETRFPVVTLEGDIFGTGGTVSGGRSNRGPGLVEKRNQLDSQLKDLDEMRSHKEYLQTQYSALSEKEAELGEMKISFTKKIDSIEADLNRMKNKRNSISKQIKDLDGMEHSLAGEISSSRDKRHITRERIREIRVSLDGLKVLDEGGNEDQDISEITNEINVKKEKLNSVNGILGRIGKELDRSRSILDDNLSEKSSLLISNRDLKIRLKALGLESYELWKKLIDTRREHKTASEDLRTEKVHYSHKEWHYQRTARDLDSMENKLVIFQKEEESLQYELEELINTWEERYPFDNSDKDKFIQDLETVKRNIRRLDRELKKIGEYNIGVLSEEESLEKRITFLHEQMDDVNSGLKELKDIIDVADRQVDRVFNKALGNIDKNFNLLFNRLFGGGEAHLRPEESESLWDAGVEIYSRPPGKRLQSLAQLSGGEQTLTAISLLFASMEVAEVPVAILDEVDAALDEVNLRRFVDLITEYSSSLQILIMTHRRITMERARLMYGVTLTEPGLSKIVGVRVDDWK